MNFSIIGNYETVKEQILNLKDEKITDLLVVTEVTHMDESWNKENDVIVNKLIKEINSEIKQHVS